VSERGWSIDTLAVTVDGSTKAILIAGAVRPIGYCKVGPLDDDCPVLVDLFVQPLFRRLGIGRALVQRGIDLATRCGKPLHVYYLPDSPARPLFEDMGFEPTGARGLEGVDGAEDYIWAAYWPQEAS
jgi:GNAT superfamily N-acetyltransferase